MTALPRRREQRRTHLDAHTVPVERALLGRAEALEREVLYGGGFIPEDQPDRTPGMLGVVAAEFRSLAEELHWIA